MTRIVAGWYFRGEEKVHEIILNYKRGVLWKMNSELAKKIVATEMGYNYPEEIDFRYFDRSCDDE